MEKTELLPLQMECTLFFQENPHTFETVGGIALRLGRKPEDIGPILDNLVALSILEKIGDGDNAIFRYIQPEIMSELDVT